VPYTPGLDIVVIGAGCLILAAFAEWRERRREAARVMATA
jgi:hypothetical protein